MNYPAIYLDNPGSQKPAWVFESYLRFLRQTGIDLVGQRVCDIGCGNGTFLSLITKTCQCWGADISPYAIDECRKRQVGDPDRLFVLDLEKTQLPSALSLDVITCFDVLEHLVNYLPMQQTLDASLVKEGYLVLTTPNANCWDRMAPGVRYYAEKDLTHRVLFTPYTLDFFMRSMGLRKVTMSTPYPFYWQHNWLTQHILLGGQIFAVYQKQ